VRQLPASKDVNTGAEGSMALDAATRRLVKPLQTEKACLSGVVLSP
jgi:hypothetical protein